PMVWNLANWLEGLEYILETDTDSLEEVQQVRESISTRFVSLPIEPWNPQPTDMFSALILRADSYQDPLKLIDRVNKAQSQNQEIKLEIRFSRWEDFLRFEDIFPHIFANFSDLSLLHHLLDHTNLIPYGLSFQQEVEEEVGMLNFDLLDEILLKLGRGNEQAVE
ncbi:MAG: hypothetical protein AAF694_13945, partial [Bacteroidota bacterium]